MLKVWGDIGHDARHYRQWFDFVAGELSAGAEKSSSDLADTFCAGGNELDGRTATPADASDVADVLARSLQVFEELRLVSGRLKKRYTPLGFEKRMRVAQLTPKGRKVQGFKRWRRESLFWRHLASHVVRRAWKPVAAAIAVAGAVGTVLKLWLLWNSQQAVIAGALAGVATLAGSLLRGRH